jgi:deoxyribose-phosphate aldolase
MEAAALARIIDHTLLKPEASIAEIDTLCAEALRYSFASICVNPWWVTAASATVANSPVKVCTVIGFPLGANRTETKVAEANLALEQGARELDMVLNIGALKSGVEQSVANDIRAVAGAAHAGHAILKVILETCLLSEAEKALACRIAVDCGADFVKTSTGFAKGGATEGDIALMRRIVGPEIGVKASGGVRTYEDALRMVAAGATRIGASASVAIVSGASAGAGAY